MKQPTLSILTAAVILAPLTALAQKIQSKTSIIKSSNSMPADYLRSQINHNAYGRPLPIATADNKVAENREQKKSAD